MTERYTAVCYITIKATADVEPAENGVRIKLLTDPKRVSDTTIFVSKGQDVPSDAICEAVRQLTPIIAIEREAELSKLPDNVEKAESIVDVKKEELN